MTARSGGATPSAPVKSSPVVVGERVVVGADDGRLVALGRADGRSVDVPRHEGDRVVARDPRGFVVVGSSDGDVYAVDASTGVLAGRFRTRWAGVVVAARGR